MKVVRVATLVLAILGLGAAPGWAQGAIVLPKPGQVGLSVGGGYGGFLESGNVGSIFRSGPALNIRLRYRMRYERGIGLAFESHRIDPRQAPGVFDVTDPSSVDPTKLSLITSGAEFYQMFGTRTRTTRMLTVGAGLAQMRVDTNAGDLDIAELGGDGLFVSAGAGVERFFFSSWAWDLSSRYMAVFRDGRANHNVQVALGVIFYASY